jgi:2-polyprenyl-3-methyl-5-hydroxy-6-metoxy-1,4-benzoquinol methylase
MFVEIPPDVLLGIATDSERMPKLYYHHLAIARKFFWLRLKCISALMMKNLARRDSCLDFGCGSGVFLPSLSKLFRSVRGIDIELVEAPKIIAHYALPNVALISADIFTVKLDEQFDAIVAADVLEHFNDVNKPIVRIKQWLKDDGLLFTSLPTENICTKMTRIVGKYTKPADHYHTGEEVEAALRAHGFHKVDGKKLVTFFPMYLLGVWRKQANSRDAE